ncbi:MAG: glucose-1-phosphate thymidylyltransferase [Patescibacteria group bacterium]
MYRQFEKENFFDLSNFEFRDIFDNVNFVWEAIPKIENYINSLFQKRILVGNYKDKKNVFVGEGSIVMSEALIDGPAIIGKNCVIGHASYLRQNCLFGDNVQIGHGSEIKNSIFLNNARAAHLNYIGDSIIGNNVNISGGAMVANYRLDKQPVGVHAGNQWIETGLQKFGAIIGDSSNIGANAVLNPGTILEKKTIVYPLTSVKGVHKNNDTIR